MGFARARRLLVVVALALAPFVARAQPEPDWKIVEQALGKSGQVQPGGVFRVNMPRTHLKVTVEGVDVKAGFALGSYATFGPIGKQTMIMGDLVLLDEEVDGVMAGLLQKGIAVTAVRNHLNQISPHVMYMHYSAVADPARLATALREALSASATPLRDSPAPAPSTVGPRSTRSRSRPCSGARAA